MIAGLIITACIANAPGCPSADPRTCHRLHLCQDYWYEIGEMDRPPSQDMCQKQGLMTLGKPQGWLDDNPDKRLLSWRCGEKVDFDKHKEIDT